MTGAHERRRQGICSEDKYSYLQSRKVEAERGRHQRAHRCGASRAPVWSAVAPTERDGRAAHNSTLPAPTTRTKGKTARRRLEGERSTSETDSEPGHQRVRGVLEGQGELQGEHEQRPQRRRARRDLRRRPCQQARASRMGMKVAGWAATGDPLEPRVLRRARTPSRTPSPDDGVESQVLNTDAVESRKPVTAQAAVRIAGQHLPARLIGLLAKSGRTVLQTSV